MDTAVAALKETQTYLTAEFNPNSVHVLELLARAA